MMPWINSMSLASNFACVDTLADTNIAATSQSLSKAAEAAESENGRSVNS